MIKTETYRTILSATGNIQYFAWKKLQKEANPSLKKGMPVKITVEWEE